MVYTYKKKIQTNMLEKQSESKNIQEALMTSKDVVDFYSEIDSLGIKIWIDGGWSVDAFLGRQLRTHKDIDIAIQWRDVPKLREILTTKGYRQVREDNQWNFVLRDDNAHEIDVHKAQERQEQCGIAGHQDHNRPPPRPPLSRRRKPPGPSVALRRLCSRPTRSANDVRGAGGPMRRPWPPVRYTPASMT